MLVANRQFYHSTQSGENSDIHVATACSCLYAVYHFYRHQPNLHTELHDYYCTFHSCSHAFLNSSMSYIYSYIYIVIEL